MPLNSLTLQQTARMIIQFFLYTKPKVYWTNYEHVFQNVEGNLKDTSYEVFPTKGK